MTRERINAMEPDGLLSSGNLQSRYCDGELDGLAEVSELLGALVYSLNKLR